MEKSSIHGDNPQVTEAQWGWLSGIIDGEGSIFMAMKKNGKIRTFQATVVVSNTDAQIIAETVRILDLSGIPFYLNSRKNNHLGDKEIHQITINRLSALETLLPKIRPSLIGAKKGKISLMQRWVTLRLPKKNLGGNAKRAYSPEELSLAEELRNLNEHTRDSEEEMMCSELRRKLAEVAEMTTRLESRQLALELGPQVTD